MEPTAWIFAGRLPAGSVEVRGSFELDLEGAAPKMTTRLLAGLGLGPADSFGTTRAIGSSVNVSYNELVSRILNFQALA